MRRNKFNNIKVIIDGIRFDSKKEGEYYNQLKFLKKLGEVDNIELQVPFKCVVNGDKICTYRLDFRVTYTDGTAVSYTHLTLPTIYSV